MEIESRYKYHPGGFHPTHIGESFHGGKYIVIDKLGQGQFSTVWLVKNVETNGYVSLKILASELPQATEELDILRRVPDAPEGDVGKDSVVRLIDDFIHIGPNGQHQCIVTEVLGPKLSSDIEDLYPGEIFPLHISRSIVRHVTHAFRFLHQNRIVHGDLHFGNILYTSPKLANLQDDDIVQYFGECEFKHLQPGENGAGESPHIPRYLVFSPFPDPLIELCIGNEADVRVKICDFSESTTITATTPPKNLHSPTIFSAPEVLLVNPGVPAASSDIWALAAVYHRIIFGGRYLIRPPSMQPGKDVVLQDIVLRLGKLPEPWWSLWEDRDKYCDESGKALPSARWDNPSLLWPPKDFMPADELAIFESVVRSMVALDPEKRATIEDVVKSEWFVRYCDRNWNT